MKVFSELLIGDLDDLDESHGRIIDAFLLFAIPLASMIGFWANSYVERAIIGDFFVFKVMCGVSTILFVLDQLKTNLFYIRKMAEYDGVIIYLPLVWLEYLIFGALFSYGFVYYNSYGVESKDSFSKEYTVSEYCTHSKTKYIIIDCGDFEKKFHYKDWKTEDYWDKAKVGDTIVMKCVSGNLGYDVILEKKLK